MISGFALKYFRKEKTETLKDIKLMAFEVE